MKIRLTAFLLPLFLALSLAHISYPPASFFKALGVSAKGDTVTYKGAQISIEELGGRLYKVHYQGPADDYETAADVLAAAVGDGGIKKPFVDWITKNKEKIAAAKKPLTVGVERAYFLVIKDGKGLVFDVVPYEVPAQAFADKGHIIGKKGVLIREYSDFQCPYCKMFFEKALPEIKKRYIETGKARFEFNHFPLTEIHKESLDAAIASDCAGEQGKFWEFHDQVFKNGAGDYDKKAAALGLNVKKFDSCRQQASVREGVLAQRKEAVNLGLNGTPSVFVGPFLLPNAFDIDAYARYIEMAAALNKK